MVSVLIMTCDSYSDLWNPFFMLYKRYWKHNYKTYIGTETKDCEYTEAIKTTGIWTKRVRETLEQIDSEYVVFLLDDFFFHKEVDQTRIDYALSQFKDDTAVFNLEQTYDAYDTESDLKGFKLRQNKRPYLNSCQPSIWNRKKLIERLQKDQTPHEWELSLVDSPYKHYINSAELIFDIGYYKERKPWCIVQGKWATECIGLFKKENIKVDFSERGFFNMKLSIIIPYYKTLDLTKKLLDTLCPQLTDEVEVILVDDGCNEKELDKYPINVIHQENGGVSKARNTGLDEAQGDYIAFIDSDDMITDNYVDKILTKIKSNNFDYCFFSWEYNGGNKVVINDNPPSWNTSVWNCIYKRDLIGKIRFNENKQIAEDTEFNLKVRKGKKANIQDILYIYNAGRDDSLTTRYSKGETGMEKDVETQVIIYRSYLSKIGGIETAVYNACNMLKEHYDIVFVYDTIDIDQLRRLRQLVKCVQYTNQKLKCKTFIYYGINPVVIEKDIEAERVIQQVCCDVEARDYNYSKTPKTTIITADSEASAKAMMRKYPEWECGVLYNLFDIPKPKRVLNLMSATRLSSEKGYGRMKMLAKRMITRGIPFEWTVFTNDLPDEEIDGFIFRKPRLNVVDYMGNKDYGFQLSDTESWGCTVTEFLESGVPVVCTDYASATEQVEDGANGFILKRDMSNMDEVIDKMYSSNLKGFEHKPKYSVKQWKDLIGKMKPKKDYIYEPNEIYQVKALMQFTDTIQGRVVQKDEVFILEDETRLDVLRGNNENQTKYVEIIG